MNRRQVLGAMAGMTALAGCTDAEADGEYPWPTVGEDARDGWERTAERGTTHEWSRWGIDALTVHERTHTYDYRDLRESISERTDGELDRSFARFVASRLALDGIGRRLATPERLADNAMGQIEGRFRNNGIESIERVEAGEPLPSIDGEIIEYRGSYGVPAFTREIEAYGTSRTIDFESGAIAIEGVFGVWKPNAKTAFIAGGAYPSENYTREKSVSLESETDIEFTTDIDLEIDPASLRERIIALIEATG